MAQKKIFFNFFCNGKAFSAFGTLPKDIRSHAAVCPAKKRMPKASSFLKSYIFSSSIISSVTIDSGVTPGSKSRYA